jgi:1-deoxy-D-xylulose-5-phosphate reductoisomerase
MKKITILGSTGSIGTQTLDVIDQNIDDFTVCALTSNTNIDLLIEQTNKYAPEAICLSGFDKSEKLEAAIPKGTKVYYGSDGLHQICLDIACDVVLLSVVGIAGLLALESCVKNNIAVALANKEALVCGGRIIRDIFDKYNAKVYPVDSELSAIFQCLNNGFETKDIRRLILTASGGPFRRWDKSEIENATAQDALKHPNWNMGQKITIDCATMMNKGLEMMETRWLFDVEPEKIDVFVHEKSIVHSMVEYIDGSVLAQMGVTDMRQPIQYALGYPNRSDSPSGYLDFTQHDLSFYPPDKDKFPCLRLAISALNDNNTAVAVALNAANEIAVNRFLSDEFNMGHIATIVEKSMNKYSCEKVMDTKDIMELDGRVRKFAQTLI